MNRNIFLALINTLFTGCLATISGCSTLDGNNHEWLNIPYDFNGWTELESHNILPVDQRHLPNAIEMLEKVPFVAVDFSDVVHLSGINEFEDSVYYILLRCLVRHPTDGYLSIKVKEETQEIWISHETLGIKPPYLEKPVITLTNFIPKSVFITTHIAK